MPYLSASVMVIHYEEALYQVYAPLPLPLPQTGRMSEKFLASDRGTVDPRENLGFGVLFTKSCYINSLLNSLLNSLFALI